MRAIAKRHGCSTAAINEVIDRWAESTIDDKLRKHSLALELARLDELQQVFYRWLREKLGEDFEKLRKHLGARLKMAMSRVAYW